MPERPLKVCRWPGCNRTTRTPSGYCEQHEGRREEQLRECRRQWSRDRGRTGARGYDGEWVKLRARFLTEHPLCAICLEHGYVRAASVVHHLKPIEDYPSLRLDPDNLQALCRDCHETLHGRKKTSHGEVKSFKDLGC